MRESGRKQGAATPCAACKLLRRRCAQDCVFAPYFPADEPQKFASVHKVFGASNVNKMLQELPLYQRGDAVKSIVYEANARIRDPIYGCVGAISSLQHQIDVLQTQLALAQAEVVHMQMRQVSSSMSSNPATNSLENGSDKAIPISQTNKSLFNMDIMMVDQPNMGDSLWSC
ncbi:LOB domain-containing protein [Actinidia chinensis var. chinensis]|uniref:LOB domain-containing protein n=1 Tax=Actinidia chinensis var. chinensis TaxID=1590841 RepID=A0A2R6QTD0_ACTCC|nr:LOB domain-containing protein [Actinidia chinensis var. chinensis]